MYDNIQAQRKNIKRIYNNGRYKIFIVNREIFIKQKYLEGWKLRFTVTFNPHKMNKYLKFKLSYLNESGYEINYTRISTCTDFNRLFHKDYPVPIEILQTMDDFLNSIELFDNLKEIN